LHRARPHPGQELVARNVLRILDGTKRCGEAARSLIFPDEARDPGTAPSPRVQDVYSLRCAPQVHGPVRDATEYIEGIVCREMNSSQDNPVFASDELGGYVPLAGGHFHGQYLAQTMDLLGIALADIGAISERRLARLIEPTMSYGLPRNLASGQPGLNGGYAVVQCSMSALVMENRHLAAPGSVDSIPSKGNVEDHVSNSTWCGRKARTIVGNTQQIIGVELLLAAQALTMVENLGRNYPIGAGSKAALDAIREVIPAAMDGDRLFSLEMKKVLQLVQSGSVLSRVEEVVGCLE
jgi:histidine ammonia-lyase